MSKKAKLEGGLDSMIKKTINKEEAAQGAQVLKNFNVYIPLDLYKKLSIRTIELGINKREYIKKLVQYDLEHGVVKP